MVAKDFLLQLAGEAEKEIPRAHSLAEIIMFTSIPFNIFGLIGNTMVLLLLCFKLRRTRFILYFENVTFANLLMILYNASALITFFMPTSPILIFSRIADMLHILVHDANLFFLTAIVTERCLTNFFTAWWKHYRPKYFSIILSVVLWILSALLALVNNFTCYPRFHIDNDDYMTSCHISVIFKIIAVLGVFGSIMIFCTIAIFIKTQSTKHPTGLDITIVAIVFFFLLFDLNLRFLVIITFWDLSADMSTVAAVFLLVNSLHVNSTPSACILVGFLRREAGWEPLPMYIQRALSGKEPEEQKTENKQTEEQPIQTSDANINEQVLE